VDVFTFTGPFRFLSNFLIEPDGSHVEGEFQRSKCARLEDRRAFYQGASMLDSELTMMSRPLKTPKECKAIGRKVTLRADWEDVKLDIMLFYVRKKFTDSPELAQMLQATGTGKLVEGNTWGDTFWGVCRGRGLNNLGLILMQVREDL